MWLFAAGFVSYPLLKWTLRRLSDLFAFWLRLRRFPVGVYVEDVGRWTYFYPRTPKAKLAATDVCSRRYSRTVLFDGWRVPYDDRRTVYEGIAQHPRFPQNVQTCLNR